MSGIVRDCIHKVLLPCVNNNLLSTCSNSECIKCGTLGASHAAVSLAVAAHNSLYCHDAQANAIYVCADRTGLGLRIVNVCPCILACGLFTSDETN